MLRSSIPLPKAAQAFQRLPSGRLKRGILLAKLVQLHARRGEHGLTLLVALVAAVVIVSAAASLASRTLSTQLGSSHLSESREAREAAEAGMATVISELNRERNRQLLTADVAMTAWSSPTNEAVLTNVCSDTTDPTPDPRALALGQGTPQPVAGSNGQLQFTLMALEVTTADRRGSFRSSRAGTVTASNYNPRLINPDDPQGFGYLRVEVKGEAKNKSGDLLSSSTLVRDFKLIPKSCRRSPAPPYGNEVRASLMRPLIVGFNGGGFTTISNGAHAGLKQAICLIQPTATKCGGSNPADVDGIPVLPMALGANLDSWLPAAERYPCPGGGLCTASTPPPEINTNSHNYINIRPDGTVIRLCSYNPAATPDTLACPPSSTINPYCVRAPLPAPATQSAFHCRVDRIITAPGKPLYVDTSRGPIYLYINAAWASSSIPIQAEAEIQHRFCSPPPDGRNGCPTKAPVASATNAPRAMIFTDLAGSLDLSPNNAITGFFLWAPKLTVNITNPGSADAFTGALWVNNLSLGPGSKSTFWDDLPNGSAATGTRFPESGNTGSTTPNTPFRDLSYDVVARPCSTADCLRGVSR